MSNWIILLLLLIIVSLALALFKKKAGKGPVDFPYQSKDVLCSPAERFFLGASDKIVGEKYRIFAKVRLADIIDVQRGLSASARQNAFNRIAGKHIDFIGRLSALAQDGAMEIYAWVLLPNHFHILCKTKNHPLASGMRRILTGYVVNFNKCHRRYGNLFAFAVIPCSLLQG